MNKWCYTCNPTDVPKGHAQPRQLKASIEAEKLSPGLYICHIHPNSGVIRFKGPISMTTEDVVKAKRELINEGKVY